MSASLNKEKTPKTNKRSSAQGNCGCDVPLCYHTKRPAAEIHVSFEKSFVGGEVGGLVFRQVGFQRFTHRLVSERLVQGIGPQGD